MDPAVLRDDMVDGLEYALDDVDERVASAMRTVPRRAFVEEGTYDDRTTTDAATGTRVLAPTTVGRLLDALALDGDDETLVVGAGVGYTAAVLAEIVGSTRVHAVDIARGTVLAARRNLDRAGYGAVLVDCRDGADGLPEYAPFDRVLVEAAAVSPPRRLLDQIGDGGRLVLPLGGPDQTLTAVAPTGDGHRVLAEHGTVGFEPLLVDGEQAGTPPRNRTEREDREFASQGHFAPTGWEYEWVDWDERLDGGRGHHGD